jgi:hypothetical protein
MLKFALKNRKALDAITGDWRMELRAFELSEREWTLAEQLRDVLEVIPAPLYDFRVKPLINPSGFHFTDTQGRYSIFLPRHAEPCHGYSCHGPH